MRSRTALPPQPLNGMPIFDSRKTDLELIEDDVCGVNSVVLDQALANEQAMDPKEPRGPRLAFVRREQGL
jgi:hypothetical protein